MAWSRESSRGGKMASDLEAKTRGFSSRLNDRDESKMIPIFVA